MGKAVTGRELTLIVKSGDKKCQWEPFGPVWAEKCAPDRYQGQAEVKIKFVNLLK